MNGWQMISKSRKIMLVSLAMVLFLFCTLFQSDSYASSRAVHGRDTNAVDGGFTGSVAWPATTTVKVGDTVTVSGTRFWLQWCTNGAGNYADWYSMSGRGSGDIEWGNLEGNRHVWQVQGIARTAGSYTAEFMAQDTENGTWFKEDCDFTILPPTPTVSIGRPSATLTRGGPVTYTVTYSGATSINLTNSNITLNKTGTANGTVDVSGTGSTRTVTISSITGDGSLGISVAAGTAANTNGSDTGAGPSATFTVDNTSPSMSVSAPSAEFARGGPATYTLTYTGADTISLSASNITLNKTGTANGTVTVSGTGNTRTVSISSITGDGTLGISVAAGTASDAAGNIAAGAASSTALKVDNTLPTISANPASGSTITIGSTVQLTISDESGGSGIGSISYKWDSHSATSVPYTSPYSSTKSVSVTAPTNTGSHTLNVTGVDAAGNSTSQSFTYNAIDIPKVGNLRVVSVGSTTAVISAEVTDIGATPVTEVGVVYSTTNANPTVSDTKIEAVSLPTGAGGSGTFNTTVTGIPAGATYYVRAYAINGSGIGYSSGNGTFKSLVYTDRVTAANINYSDADAAIYNKYTPNSEVVEKVIVDPSGDSVDNYTVQFNLADNSNIKIKKIRVVKIVEEADQSTSIVSDANENPTGDYLVDNSSGGTAKSINFAFNVTGTHKDKSLVIYIKYTFDKINEDPTVTQFTDNVTIAAKKGSDITTYTKSNIINVRDARITAQ